MEWYDALKISAQLKKRKNAILAVGKPKETHALTSLSNLFAERIRDVCIECRKKHACLMPFPLKPCLCQQGENCCLLFHTTIWTKSRKKVLVLHKFLNVLFRDFF